MAFIVFPFTVLITGIIGSCLPQDTSAHIEKPDYHYVPYAGASFGA